MQEGKSVLVFCGTRANVEQTALDLKGLCAAGVLQVAERSTNMSSGSATGKRARFLADLPKNIPDKLRECLEHGIGYHHASVLCLWVAALCQTCALDVEPMQRLNHHLLRCPSLLDGIRWHSLTAVCLQNF